MKESLASLVVWLCFVMLGLEVLGLILSDFEPTSAVNFLAMFTGVLSGIVVAEVYIEARTEDEE